MPAYDIQFDPIVLPDQHVKLLPTENVRRVEGLEPMPLVGPIDFGNVAAGNEIAPDNTEVTELEMEQNQLGQFRANVLSNVELELRQVGRQGQRYSNANSVGVMTPVTPDHTNELYVLKTGVPRFLVTNPNTYDLAKTLVSFTGFKYNLEPEILSEDDISAQPVTFPVDGLDRAAQAASQSGTQGRQQQTQPRNRSPATNTGGR